jgi:hypothetical protein
LSSSGGALFFSISIFRRMMKLTGVKKKHDVNIRKMAK